MNPLPRLRQAMTAGDGPTLLGEFRALADPDDLAFAVAETMAAPDSIEFLSGLVDAADPDEPLPRLLLARHLSHLGWQARTGQRAQHVTAAQFATMHDYLRRAERILLELTARHPGYGPAWSERIHNARGLEMGAAESQRRYRRAVAAVPHFYAAQSAYLQNVTSKWTGGGGHDKMHAFAWESFAAAPPGGPHGGLIAVAHIEEWAESGEGASAYITRPAVVTELRTAGTAAAGYTGLRAVLVHQWLALALSLAGAPDAAAVHFRALDGLTFTPEFPWTYLGGDPAANYAKQRAKAGM